MMRFKREDVAKHLITPDCTFIELKDGTRIYNYRNKKNYIIFKNGKRCYKRKITEKQQEKNLVVIGKIAEIFGEREREG